jgi:3-oxoacyl-[acyl-carrier-protein] synthase II
VVITGMGAVTPFGIGRTAFCDALFRGLSGATMINTFDTSSMPTKFGAAVTASDSELDPLIANQKSLKTMARSTKFAVIAAAEAVADSGLETGRLEPYRLGTSIGTGGTGFWDVEQLSQMFQFVVDSIEPGTGNKANAPAVWRNTLERMNPLTPLKSLPNMLAAHIAINHNARGICQTLATACTSSAQAIGEACRHVRAGIADVMICGGADSMIHPYGFVAFSALGVMSKNNQEYRTAARPFDRRRDGFMLGEGAAMFVMEEFGHCMRRGARPLAELAGYASTCDAFRLTDEPPQAWGSIEAMRMALDDARLTPGDIDYVNAHGTGTVMNDKTETFAIKSVFGEKARSLPVSSTKSMVGHLVAAAGAVELAACVAALNHQLIPPTINYQEIDAACDLDYVPNQSREARLRTVLSNSFGFGGQNACLILKEFS